jgi:hypothetical protein
LRLELVDSCLLEPFVLLVARLSSEPAWPPSISLLLRVLPSEAINDVGVALADIAPTATLPRLAGEVAFGLMLAAMLKLEGRAPVEPEAAGADSAVVCAVTVARAVAFPLTVLAGFPSPPFSREARTDCQLALKLGAVAADERTRLPDGIPAHPAF